MIESAKVPESDVFDDSRFKTGLTVIRAED
jgi:hypothetical protein